MSDPKMFPALKLLWSPGHVLLHGHEWARGAVVPIPAEGLSFGGQGDVRAQGVLHDHCSIASRVVNETAWPARERPDVRLKLLQHQSYSLVNGRPRKETWLSHRDLVELPGGVLFRVLERDDIEVTSVGLEAAVAAAPDDPEIIHVWRDFLLDEGDPLGERMAKASGGEQLDDAKWLDSFAPLYEMGRLQVEWSQGLATRVVLRDTSSGFDRLDQALGQLLSLRVMRFVRELTLDVSSDKRSIAEGLAALKAVTLPSTLERVSLGDVSVGDRPMVELALSTAGWPVEVGYFTDGQIEILKCDAKFPHRVGVTIPVGAQLHLVRRGFVHEPDNYDYASYSITRDGPRFVLKRLKSLDDRAKANGYAVDDFPLRDGDTIQLGETLAVRFSLKR